MGRGYCVLRRLHSPFRSSANLQEDTHRLDPPPADGSHPKFSDQTRRHTDRKTPNTYDHQSLQLPHARQTPSRNDRIHPPPVRLRATLPATSMAISPPKPSLSPTSHPHHPSLYDSLPLLHNLNPPHNPIYLHQRPNPLPLRLHPLPPTPTLPNLPPPQTSTQQTLPNLQNLHRTPRPPLHLDQQLRRLTQLSLVRRSPRHDCRTPQLRRLHGLSHPRDDLTGNICATTHHGWKSKLQALEYGANVGRMVQCLQYCYCHE